MDPLSDVLSLLKPRTYVAGGFDVGGELSVRFGAHDGIKCYAMVSGQCWLAVEGVPEPVLLNKDDCILLPKGWPFRLATDLSLPPIDAHVFLDSAETRNNGRMAVIQGGGGYCMVGGYFAFDGSHARILLDVLPPIAHIRKESDKAAMRWSLERMRQELSEERPGGILVAEHLAHMMLVQALRLYLAEGPQGGVGWLFALADPQISAAIQAMHSTPAERWTLEALAAKAGMSRSTFAQRFKEKVGLSPMDYLTRWRMLVAGDRLSSAMESVAEIALSLGYESESAFSTAFKRVMGCSPRQYARGCPPAALPARRDEKAAGQIEVMAGSV
jgi:AraC-like DNA-binding protein